MSRLVTAGAVGAGLATLHSVVNARLLRVPPPAGTVTERVSVLLPVRDEAPRVAACLSALLGATGVPDLEVLVLDDGSTDDTVEEVRRVADGRVRLLAGGPLPAGWLGKPYACARLGAHATGSVLVFVDADVVVAPDALARTVRLLRAAGLDLVSPYPRQLADGPGPRLVQPLLQWSWLTLLPLRPAERSPRPSLVAANGQLLCVDAAAYRRAGGHGTVRAAVLDDLALARAVKAAGGRVAVADGTDLATCRMYESWAGLREGYTKSLWAAFGSPAGAAAVTALLAVLYLVPPAAALTGSRAGLAGYAAAVAGRMLCARRTGGRALPDALAHPASVAALGWLTVRSVVGHRRGTLTWKGRPVGVAP